MTKNKMCVSGNIAEQRGAEAIKAVGGGKRMNPAKHLPFRRESMVRTAGMLEGGHGGTDKVV